MKKLWVFSTVILALSGLTSCGGGGSNSEGKPGESSAGLQTFTESEVLSDGSAISAAEKRLSDLGIQFKKEFNRQNGVETPIYHLDKAALERSTATSSEVLPLLKAFVASTAAYLQKYSGPFHLQMADGSQQTRKMYDSVREELNAKISISNKLIQLIEENAKNKG